MSELFDKILSGDRRSLAKGITLIESSLPEHQAEANDLVERSLSKGNNSFRIGISGPPGVGKSTFIEAFGSHLIAQTNQSLAVLAVDPSSPVTGGSLLADKTRMEELAQNPRAFIRPSPSAGALGGVAHKTFEAMHLCEAAGYKTILVETVGVGQSEVDVRHMVDFFILLAQPNSGDELQGIKRGIMELADLIVVNKWDGDAKKSAEVTAAQVKSALGLFPQKEDWQQKVLLVSSEEKVGLAEVQRACEEFKSAKNQELQSQRKIQNILWFEKLTKETFFRLISQKCELEWKKLRMEVGEQKKSPLAATRELFKLLKL